MGKSCTRLHHTACTECIAVGNESPFCSTISLLAIRPKGRWSNKKGTRCRRRCIRCMHRSVTPSEPAVCYSPQACAMSAKHFQHEGARNRCVGRMMITDRVATVMRRFGSRVTKYRKDLVVVPGKGHVVATRCAVARWRASSLVPPQQFADLPNGVAFGRRRDGE